MRSTHNEKTPQDQSSGPWRWVVAFGACWVMFCIMSLFRSYGVIYVAILHTYGLTRQQASWPFSLCGAVLNCTAFIPGILSSFLSNRQIVLLGSVTGSFGIILCFFANDLSWILVFFGIFYGLGMGIVIPPLLVLLNKYFIKFRATACGICFTGAALSSIIFPPVTDLILDEYGLRGTFLLLGGLVLNTLVGTALLKEDSIKPAPSRSEEHQQEFKKCLLKRNNGTANQEAEIEIVAGDCFQRIQEATMKNGTSKSDYSNGSVHELKEAKLFCQLRDEDNNIPGTTELKEYFVFSPDEDRNSKGRIMSIFWKIRVGLRDYCTTVRFLVTDAMFIITTVSSTCGWMAYFTFSMIIVDYGLDQGVDKSQAVVLVSVYSATEIVGRLCTGWISDMGLVNRRDILSVTSFTSGLVLFGFPFCHNALTLNLLTGLYGLLVGCFIILYSVLLADYLGVQKLAVATSLMFFLGGSLTLLRPLVVGYVRDTTGHYHNLFYILAGMSLVGGAVWFLEPLFVRRQKNVYLKPISEQRKK